jgi:Chaperone of endosialidase
MKTRIPPVLITIALVCFGLLPKGHGVLPPPDGGYPGFTTAEGNSALQHLTTGVGNTATGWHSLFANTTGNLNTAIGAGTLLLNTGDNNTATGALALLSNTTGSSNTAIGYEALVFNTTGVQNTASGYYSLHANTEGFGNTAFGDLALFSNTIGHNNIALGWGAGGDLTTGSGNICIGHRGLNAESSTIRIGTTDLQTSTYIAGIAGQTVGAGGSTCYVDNDGKLGVFLSARRFKTDIADMGGVSEALLALRPVTFHYKPELDKTGIPQFGLIAEEVAKVNPDLVTHDAKGELSTVRYEAVNAMLLNEFLKEHRNVQELEANAVRQQKQIETLTAGLQKVSAQIELNKPAPQTVKNDD